MSPVLAPKPRIPTTTLPPKVTGAVTITCSSCAVSYPFTGMSILFGFGGGFFGGSKCFSSQCVHFFRSPSAHLPLNIFEEQRPVEEVIGELFACSLLAEFEYDRAPPVCLSCRGSRMFLLLFGPAPLP